MNKTVSTLVISFVAGLFGALLVGSPTMIKIYHEWQKRKDAKQLASEVIDSLKLESGNEARAFADSSQNDGRPVLLRDGYAANVMVFGQIGNGQAEAEVMVYANAQDAAKGDNILAVDDEVISPGNIK